MPLCKFCKGKIEWIQCGTKALPVEGDLVSYNDCDTGDLLVTQGGNTYRVQAESSYPSIKGYLCHTPICPGRREIFGRE